MEFYFRDLRIWRDAEHDRTIDRNIRLTLIVVIAIFAAAVIVMALSS